MSQVTDSGKLRNTLTRAMRRTISIPAPRVYLPLVAVCVLALTLAASAGAAMPTTGDHVTFDFGRQGSRLWAGGVRTTTLKPATLKGTRLTLPVSDVAIPRVSRGQLVLRGGLKLRRGRHTIKLQGLLVKLGSRSVSVNAKVGRKRMTLMSGRSRGNEINATLGYVRFSGARMRLSHRAARAIRRALRLRRVRAMSLGHAKGASAITIDPGKPRSPNDGLPASDFNFPAQTELTQPVTAAAVTSATPLAFWPRDSFIQYIWDFGGSVTAELPATPGPAIDKPAQNACPFETGLYHAAHPYGFSLPFTSGWWDVTSSTGVLRYSGAVRFYLPAHGLNILLANPVVEFNGGSSRVLFTASDPWNVKLTDMVTIPNVTLPASITPSTYAAAITTHGNQVMAGFYPPPDSWGCVQLGFSTP